MQTGYTEKITIYTEATTIPALPLTPLTQSGLETTLK